MSSKAAIVTIMAGLVTLALFGQVSANHQTNDPQKRAGLQIYLPRQITVEDSHLTLGQVTIIRGDESLVAKASHIPLGRISVPGQKVVVDRLVILSRLACNGIPAAKVTLTGAREITVKQQQQVIKGAEFAERARSFLKEHLPANSACRWDCVRIPKDLILAGPTDDITLSPKLVENNMSNQAKVRITVLADDKEVGMREVTLRLKYNYRKAVTLVEMPAGAVISPENVKIEKVVSNYPEPANWRPPYGFVARRRLPADTAIGPDMVGPAKSPVVVGRNETVVIRVKMPGLVVTAVGKTMQQGRAGEYIKVRNSDSQRIIVCKVEEDGTVEPVF